MGGVNEAAFTPRSVYYVRHLGISHARCLPLLSYAMSFPGEPGWPIQKVLHRIELPFVAPTHFN